VLRLTTCTEVCPEVYKLDAKVCLCGNEIVPPGLEAKAREAPLCAPRRDLRRRDATT